MYSAALRLVIEAEEEIYKKNEHKIIRRQLCDD